MQRCIDVNRTQDAVVLAPLPSLLPLLPFFFSCLYTRGALSLRWAWLVAVPTSVLRACMLPFPLFWIPFRFVSRSSI